MRSETQRLLATAFFTFFTAAFVQASGSRESNAPSSANSSSQSPVRIEAGYMPIFPDAQIFIIAGNHWAQKEGIDLKLIRFSDGPAMVQAVASGRLEAMYFGIGPAMVAYARGVKIKVVASNTVRGLGFIAQRDLAKYYDPADPGAMFAKFEQANGRKARIATFPRGSVPDTVLRYWLIKRLGIGVDSVDILGMGANGVQEALLAGKVDGAVTLEPILTIVEQRVPSARVLAWSKEMFPGQPGAVLAVRDDLIARHPQVVQKLVDLQVKATRYLNSKVPQAAKLISRFVGAGLVSPAIIEKALRSPSGQFIADPQKSIRPSQKLLDFQVKIGSIAKGVDLGSLFETSFYRKAVSR